MTYSWVEHTSELELHIEAASESAVFEQALRALGELISGEPGDEPAGAEYNREPAVAEAGSEALSREVVLVTDDRAALLAAWLDELVYMAETEDLVPESVTRLDLGNDDLRATVRGRRGLPRHLVKGVTYHQLTFERAGEGFRATAVLDV
ncbi:MAG TPA: archease [Solirubrobacteraceae bacterium]|nr:archease [Solirubrobacteraceae bacterium]